MRYQNIFEESWDILIILDACRFDFFREIYQDYFSGELEKRKSRGSNTGEWLTKTFTDKYDLTYISSNPYVNSFGLTLSECNPKFSYDWKATNHFSHTIDVWLDGWDESIGTVHPHEVNMAYFESQNKDKNKKNPSLYPTTFTIFISKLGRHLG
ncbi:hypothetical protein C9439_03360 [archaeon SCG-AAA382B04]|nr:hypothetical protein C9439_03360 [archaeon SCG-AAA382B04]